MANFYSPLLFWKTDNRSGEGSQLTTETLHLCWVSGVQKANMMPSQITQYFCADVPAHDARKQCCHLMKR